MRFFGTSRRLVATVGAVVVLGATGVGVAVASGGTTSTPSNAASNGRGQREYGMTQANYDGHRVPFTYTRGFRCDTSRRSTATSGCEAGAKWKKAPAKQHDPLYIMVPLGFNVKMSRMDCPASHICVDHPGTIDLRRLEPALKPLYPTLTKKQLTKALSNFATPGHEHFITDANEGKPEWWPVSIVGVTSRAEYNKIRNHQSAKYLKAEVKAGNTTGVIPTNLFLYFAVRG